MPLGQIKRLAPLSFSDFLRFGRGDVLSTSYQFSSPKGANTKHTENIQKMHRKRTEKHREKIHKHTEMNANVDIDKNIPQTNLPE